MKNRAPVRRGRAAPADRGVAESAPTLPAWKAFVVQFGHQSGARGCLFSGRIEHLHSGRRASFASPQELLAMLERMLDDLERPPSRARPADEAERR
ncbi:MAG: hypothetical protein U0802_02120 [Candidatus Binatia bacterium]